MKTVVVGLSGGVDSSVAAYLLKKEGYNVIGLFMRNWNDDSVIIDDECPWIEDSNDALQVSEILGIPFQVIDFSKEYKDKIVDYMFSEYENGRTPNPDILCNREIKFDLFLKKALDNNWLDVKAVFGIWEAYSVDDDIFILDDKGEVLAVSHCLRQQTKKSSKAFNMSLSDFIAPKSSGKKDFIGAFVVSSGNNIDTIAKNFERDLDDYNSIMIKAIADRMAEAAAEFLHEKIRKNYWGYSIGEKFSNDELIKEKYLGIRPAPGYPACPDHTEKNTIFNLLDATKNVGVKLTESLAMYPTSSVSGWYFSHPESKYFGLGKIKLDQIEDISKRKNISISEMKKWLSPNFDD